MVEIDTRELIRNLRELLDAAKNEPRDHLAPREYSDPCIENPNLQSKDSYIYTAQTSWRLVHHAQSSVIRCYDRELCVRGHICETFRKEGDCIVVTPFYSFLELGFRNLRRPIEILSCEILQNADIRSHRISKHKVYKLIPISWSKGPQGISHSGVIADVRLKEFTDSRSKSAVPRNCSEYNGPISEIFMEPSKETKYRKLIDSSWPHGILRQHFDYEFTELSDYSDLLDISEISGVVDNANAYVLSLLMGCPTDRDIEGEWYYNWNYHEVNNCLDAILLWNQQAHWSMPFRELMHTILRKLLPCLRDIKIALVDGCVSPKQVHLLDELRILNDCDYNAGFGVILRIYDDLCQALIGANVMGKCGFCGRYFGQNPQRSKRYCGHATDGRNCAKLVQNRRYRRRQRRTGHA